MKILTSNKFEELKKLIILITVAVGLTLVLANLKIGVSEVTAQILPVLVHEEHLDFGTVFPGEEHEGNFTIHCVEECIESGITYMIIQKRKPLPEGHPEYPDGGDPEMPGFYRNLCPSLTKISNEGEGDTEGQACVGPSDLSDTWVVYFEVPAIVGHVAQDHIGGVVTSNGEYGCDISIDIIE